MTAKTKLNKAKPATEFLDAISLVFDAKKTKKNLSSAGKISGESICRDDVNDGGERNPMRK